MTMRKQNVDGEKMAFSEDEALGTWRQNFNVTRVCVCVYVCE